LCEKLNGEVGPMQIQISLRDGVPVYLQILNQVKYLAACGRLEAGEQLPPVRKLAEQLLVNPNTVARAYRELESEGVVTTRRGSGVYVATGVSPLARREQNRILAERIDMLLAEAKQMNVDLDLLIRLVRQRSQAMDKGKK
jgi:GntR family transcriptional regulator